MSMSLRSRSVRFAIAAAALGLVAGSAAAVSAAVGGGGGAARDGGEGPNGVINEQLTGYEETPLALSTGGNGTFRAMVTDAGIEYTLTYADLGGTCQQAHIHFGATGQSGGISVFLCTNLGNGPVGPRRAPPRRRVSPALIEPGDVVGPARPRASRRRSTTSWSPRSATGRRTSTCTVDVPGGEIRGQIETRSQPLTAAG